MVVGHKLGSFHPPWKGSQKVSSLRMLGSLAMDHPLVQDVFFVSVERCPSRQWLDHLATMYVEADTAETKEKK